MLRDDVVKAVEDGRFHIYAIETIDQGIELLTDMPAGERDADGSYPDGTFNALVETRLVVFSEQRREFGMPAIEIAPDGGDDDKTEGERGGDGGPPEPPGT